jgi:hypothetical protein
VRTCLGLLLHLPRLQQLLERVATELEPAGLLHTWKEVGAEKGLTLRGSVGQALVEGEVPDLIDNSSAGKSETPNEKGKTRGDLAKREND